MKKIALFIFVLVMTTFVPLALARESRLAVETSAFAAVEESVIFSAENTAAQLPYALNSQNANMLKNVLLRDDVRFGSFYGAWWDGWDDVTTDDMLAHIWRMDAAGQLSVARLPNEPTWFLQNMNPYSDLLPNEETEIVLLINNFSENSDAEMLVWVSTDAKISAMVLSPTGFQRVSR